MSEKIQVAKPKAKRENKPHQTQKINLSQSISSPVDQILFLQRTIGNQAVVRLIRSGTLQAKLRIGLPVDMYEQEADVVMRIPEPQVVSMDTLSIQKTCPECEEDELRC